MMEDEEYYDPTIDRMVGRMSPQWLRRAREVLNRRVTEVTHGGVQYIVEKWDPVPGTQRSPREVAELREEMVGPPYDPYAR